MGNSERAKPGERNSANAQRRRILVVAARDPLLSRRGDQLRAKQFCAALSVHHEVDLLAPEAETRTLPSHALWSGARLSYERTLRDRSLGLLRAWISGEPLQTGLYASADLNRQLQHLAPRYDAVVLQMVRLERTSRCLVPQRLFVDLIDALSLNFSRRAQLAKTWQRMPLALEASRLQRVECTLLGRAAAASVVCMRDRHYLQELAGRGCAEDGRIEGSFENLRTVPLAVQPGSSQWVAPSSAERTTDLMFTGNLGYWVNREAVTWFGERVWPRLIDRRPELKMIVAGDRPSSGLRRRLSAVGIPVRAAPQDLRQLLRQAKVALAPMRGGAGVPVKVLEAFAEGTPVVASAWAAAGVETEATAVSELPLVIAERPEQWVVGIERLLDDQALARRMAESGRDFVRREHSEEVCDRRVASAVVSCWATSEHL